MLWNILNSLRYGPGRPWKPINHPSSACRPKACSGHWYLAKCFHSHCWSFNFDQYPYVKFQFISTTRGVISKFSKWNFVKIIFISETIPKWLWIRDYGTIHGYAKNKFNQISGKIFCRQFCQFVNIFFILSTFLSRTFGTVWTCYRQYPFEIGK